MFLAAADRNLLFGILALQMDFIRRDELIAAMNAWVLDKAKALAQILVEQGALAAADHQLLEGLVQRHLEKHGHDAERSLAAVTAPDAVRAELRRIADNDVQASLAQLPITPSAPGEALATTTPVATDGTRFQVLRPHASGGLGEVFVARDGELNREVALKEIQARHADHPESRARFVREAEITGSLEHPGIVPVYALGQHADGRPYYAMRFIRGDSLKKAIERFHESAKEDNLGLRQLLGRFVAVCNAIAYAHNRAVVHRDLKPSNIMLGEFGETLVVDWGLAKLVESSDQPLDGSTVGLSLPISSSDSELTQTGQALGTPAYMSPEQAAGQIDQVGPASDIYSLGATLYHLLTGRVPFAKEDVGAVIQKVQKGDFAPPRQVKPGVPAALEAICLRAMALDPRDRYRSATALADDVEHWLADEAVTAYAEPWPGRLGRWMRHHKGLVGGLAAMLAVGLTVAIAAWLVREAKEREANEQGLRSIAEDERLEADKQKGEAEKQKGLADDQRAEAMKLRTIAESQRNLARRYLYFSQIKLADQAWQEAHVARMDELLEQTGREDLAGFERSYLLRLGHANLWSLKDQTVGFKSVAFSPDGQRLAVASAEGTVKIWDVRTGQESLVLKGHTADWIVSVAFSPDGQRLASASYDQTVKVWDARTGQESLILKGHTNVIHSVAFSPDGQRVASASSDRTVKVWDVRTGQEALTLKGHFGSVESVAFSPDGLRLASGGGMDRTVKIWDALTGQELLTLKGHTSEVHSVAFSPDGRRLASASYDKTVKVWDARTGQESLSLRGHSDLVQSVAFSPDGRRLASASWDFTVRVWDVRTGQETLTLKGHRHAVFSVAFSPDSQRLASASSTVKIWDAGAGQESLTLRGSSSVLSVAFSPDSQRLASTSYNPTVKVWNARTGLETLTLKGHTAYARGVVFSPDGQRLASASYDKTVKVWDARTGQETLTLKGHTRWVSSVAFSPDGQRLASASYDQTAKVWDARTGLEALTLKGHTGTVWSVVFSPDGRRLASASDDKTVKVWDSRSGQESFTLKGHFGSVESVAFNPDGQRLASASTDRTVRVWDALTGQELLTLKGHTNAILSVAFSPDGQRIASASWDKTVKIWDVLTGQEALTLKGHTGIVHSVTFSPDGQRLASASADGTVKLWDATPVGEGSNLDRQALSYFRFVAETVVLKDEMVQQIRQTPTLSEPARELALAFAKDYREVPTRLNDASWSVVSRSWARSGAHALALRQAEAACRQEPDNGTFLPTLGAAQYRNSQYAAALKTLTQFDKRNAAQFKHSLPAVLAFLALTQFQLGQKPEAAATLGRLREGMRKLPPDAETKELLKEAESVEGPVK